MHTLSLPVRLSLALTLGALAFGLRSWYAGASPEVTDEYNYLGQAQQMRAAMASGDYRTFTGPIGNNDHPHLVKVLFALAMTSEDGQAAARQARQVSVIFGALAVLVLSLVSPAAGLLLAVQSSAIKYTGLAMLEAVPQAFSVISILALRRSRPDRFDGSLIVSAIALGAMAAAKFTYIPLALVVFYLLHFAGERRPFKIAAGYYVIALITFLALMPTLWVAPIGYLRDMAAFHADLTAREAAAGRQFAWFQSLVWMLRPTPDYQELFPLNFDLAIFLAGLAGLFFLKSRDGWVKVWWGVAVSTLAFWPNKWPQYPMLLYPALALSAGRFLEHWPARRVLIGATVLLAFTLRWSAVLELPIEAEAYETRTAQTARSLVQAVRGGAPDDLVAQLRVSPTPLANLGILAGLYWLRDTLRPGEVSPEQSIYLGRSLNALFGAASVGLVALVNLPAALFLAVHTAVIGQTVRSDQGSNAQFFVLAGLWLTRLPPKFRRLAPVCLAVSVAILPAYLLILVPLAVLFPGQWLRDRRDYLLFGGSTVILLADMFLLPSRLPLLFAVGNLTTGWWQAFNAARAAGFLKEAGSLTLVMDLLIVFCAVAGVFVLRRRLAVATVLVSAAALVIPLGFRPWFLLCSPLWAWSAGSFCSFVFSRLPQPAAEPQSPAAS